MIWHLRLLEDLDRNDVEACPSIDESKIDGDIVDGRRAHDGNGAHRPGGDRMIFLIEGELAGRPL
jgi:hypothetical protein